MAEVIKSCTKVVEREEAVKEAIAQAVKPEAITREQFKKANKQVIDEMMNDDKLQGMSKLLIPLTGSMFADKMEKILFGEEKKED